TRYALCRHQSDHPQRAQALRGRVLPTRSGREPHQILEDASGGGPHVLHEGQREPAAFVPARRRLLVDVGLAPVNAAAIHVARRAVRHAAPTADQDRRASRRDEDDDQDSFAHIVLQTGHLALRARKNPPSRHLSRGARRPENQTRPVNPQTLPLRTLALPPVTKMRVGATKNSRSDHPKTSPRAARSSKRCIMRASKMGCRRFWVSHSLLRSNYPGWAMPNVYH